MRGSAIRLRRDSGLAGVDEDVLDSRHDENIYENDKTITQNPI